MNDGDNHVEEEIMHVRVGDVKSHSQGGYIRHENASMVLEMP